RLSEVPGFRPPRSSRAQPLVQSVCVQVHPLAGIFQVTLSSELIHVVGYDLTRCPNILREQLMGEGGYPYGSVVGSLAHALGQTDQAPRKPAGGVVRREADDALAELGRTLYQHLR